MKTKIWIVSKLGRPNKFTGLYQIITSPKGHDFASSLTNFWFTSTARCRLLEISRGSSHFFEFLPTPQEFFFAKKMAAWTVAARQAFSLARLSTPKSSISTAQASLIQRRGFAAGGGNFCLIFLFLYIFYLIC